MSIIAQLRKKVQSIGPYTGVRYLRNQGVGFNAAYFIMFNRLPRK